MTTAVIVQARIGSSRLPGKVLQSLGRRTVLEEVLVRCRAIPGADVVVCAIPHKAADDALVPVALRAGVRVERGSESDVLSRYLQAARAVNAVIVMRITSDCPLIDPGVCGELLRLRIRAAADYASNVELRSFPHGLDCEVFTAAALAEAAKTATDSYDREHVTAWMRRATYLKRANLHSGNAALADLRWTLDYPEDLDFLRAVFAALPADTNGAMAEVLTVLDRNPELLRINARHRLADPASTAVDQSARAI